VLRAKLWDLPTRIFHWMLAGLILTAWLTAGRQWAWHRWSGYAVLGLIVFRLYWGLVGGSTARFVNFVKGPRATLAYLRALPGREAKDSPGHNPLGALSMVALLVLIPLQAGLGLFAVDIDGLESGPLSYLVDFDTGRLCAEWHELSFRVLQGLIALHLAAVAFYLIYKRQNLVAAMITGRGRFSGEAPQVRFAPAWRAAVGVMLAVAVAYVLAKGLKI